MGSWQGDAQQAAARYGLGDWFVRQMGLEAHGADLTSPAGAQGPAQFIPATARSVGLTSSTVHQRIPAYNAAAKLMARYVKQYGSVKNALVAYNAGPGAVGRSLPAETQNYLKTILPHGGGSVSAPSAPSHQPSMGPSLSLSAASAPTASPALGDPGQAGDFSSLVSSLLNQKAQPSAPSISALPAPSFAAAPALPQAYQQLQPVGAPAPPAQDRVQAGLSLVGALGGTESTAGSPTSLAGPQVAPSAPTGASASGGAAPPKTPKLASFDGKQVAGWIAPILQRARATGLWKGTVSSGYRSDAEQTRIYNSGVRPAAVPKSLGGSGSNHEGAVFPLGAVDVSDAPGLAAALKKLGVNKLQYAGSKDPVHFSHPHNGGY